MKILAPNKQYAGIYMGVVFVNGEGVTENDYLIQWFEKNGYLICRDNLLNQPADE